MVPLQTKMIVATCCLCLTFAGFVRGDGMQLQFQRQVLTDKYYCDGVAAGDINSDGHLDIVAGPQARWSMWSESGTEELVRFTPEPRFITEFVPFFDQYAQSVSLWAPDGSAIAFPGVIDGNSGIWVQAIDGEPTRIHDGSWVSWAP